MLPTPPPPNPTKPPNNPIAAAATTLQSTKYICKIDGESSDSCGSSSSLSLTDVGTYNTANTDFTDAFTGHYDSGSNRTSIAPKGSDCKQAPHRIMHRTMHRARTAQSHALHLLRPLRPPTPSARRTPG